jgi:hypothetical protein
VCHLVQHSIKCFRIGLGSDFSSFVDETLEFLGIIGWRLWLASHIRTILHALHIVIRKAGWSEKRILETANGVMDAAQSIDHLAGMELGVLS